eukprot:366301-Chlamydomonas_euryale.AAC.58
MVLRPGVREIVRVCKGDPRMLYARLDAPSRPRLQPGCSIRCVRWCGDRERAAGWRQPSIRPLD